MLHVCLRRTPPDRRRRRYPIGLLLGIAATAGFRSLLYGIGVVEFTVIVPVSAAMLAVCLAVAAISARPWLHIDPMETIRHA